MKIIDERELMDTIIERYGRDKLDEFIRTLCVEILDEIYKEKFNKLIKRKVISQLRFVSFTYTT